MAIEWSSNTFRLDRLSFRQGDAEALPLKDNCFDVVVNVESSHLYPNLELFYNEVKRVLKHQGYFLYADQMEKSRMEGAKQKLKETGLVLIKSTDIIANVLESIRILDERRKAVFKKYARDEKDYRQLADWARLVGTSAYEAYCNEKDLLPGPKLNYKSLLASEDFCLWAHLR